MVDLCYKQAENGLFDMKDIDSNKPDFFDHKEFLKSLSTNPGVYRMYNDEDTVIYVGKARNLRNRVSSYFNKAHNSKTLTLVSQIHHIEITVTHTEGEALLLEDMLIKKYQPRYNVLLRDDKSYPYIYLSTHQTFPRLSLYRGSTKKREGTFFGPFPSSAAVRKSIHLLHRLFRLRQCTDSYFKNRSRPCLQYQIKRCSGPCVGLISKTEYAQDINHTLLFLKGKTQQIISDMVAAMERASVDLEFELAATYRDRISYLRQVLEKQYVSGTQRASIDVVACDIKGGQCCVQVFYFREGTNQGNKAFYPKIPSQHVNEARLLDAFISQYYLAGQIPEELIVSHEPESRAVLEEVFSERLGRQVRIKHRVRSERARWLQNAVHNAREALEARLVSRSSQQKRLSELRKLLHLNKLPKRMECFDISHIQGNQTVASCVVFDENGALKSDYRRFKIKDITPGDDYAAMAQALKRRYRQLLKEEGLIPDIVFIDGGKGQLSVAIKVMQVLMADDGPLLVGVSKGTSRKPGMERLHVPSIPYPLEPGARSAALLLIQQIRDEAHRFAITGHRQLSRKKATHSSLEAIEGLGPKRRQVLIKHFGGIHGIKRAGVEDMQQISGISPSLAKRIYDYLHSH